MYLGAKYVWMDGTLVEAEKATVPFLSAALHYGAGVFEGIRCYDTDKGPAVFRLKEHMLRLENSARVLGLKDLPYTQEEMAAAVRATIRASEMRDCYIRPLIYLTDTMGLNIDQGKIHLGIGVYPMGTYLGPDALEKGARAMVSSYTRLHPNVMMTKGKITGNYANSLLAKAESARLGFDEAILLDPQGLVAECSGENIFLVRQGVLVTPPTTTILEGITRDALITLAHDLGIRVVEQPVSRDQLYIADEVFCCGTAAEVSPLTEIDFRKVGDGKVGPISRQISKTFFDVVRGRHPRSPEWLDYVK